MLPKPTPDFTKEDYIAALDNLSKLHVAVIDEKKDLEARVAHLKGAIETMNEQAGAREEMIATLRGKLETAHGILAEQKYSMRHSYFQRSIESLVAARYSLRNGNTNDGMYELEKVLDEADSAWRTRAG